MPNDNLDVFQGASIMMALHSCEPKRLEALLSAQGMGALDNFFAVLNSDDHVRDAVAHCFSEGALGDLSDRYFGPRINMCARGARLGVLGRAATGRLHGMARFIQCLDAMESAGWTPSLSDLTSLIEQSYQHLSSELILWVAKRGRPPALDIAIAHLFSEGRKEPSLIADFNALIDSGAIADADGRYGLTDAIAQQGFHFADILAQRGFKPRLATVARRFNEAGMSPVASYMRLIQEMDASTPAKMADKKAKIAATLDWLADAGARFAYDGERARDPRLDPFFASCLNRGSDRNKELYDIAYAKLLEHGANPNQSGRYLAFEIEMAGWSQGDLHVQEALNFGASPSVRPELALSGLARWKFANPGGGAIALETARSSADYFDKLAALGADPSKINDSTKHAEHPIARAIEAQNHALALHAHKRGASAGNVDPVHGQTILHALGVQRGAKALKALVFFLKDPPCLALVNAPLRAQCDYGGQGQTPLMVACRQLNLGAVKALVGAGADPNLQDAKKQTALHHAGRRFGAKAQDRAGPVIEFLLAHGADPSLPNSQGLTPGQSMALRSPLGALSELLAARPQDLLGPGAASEQTKARLAKRGAQAISIVEQAVLTEEAPSTPERAPRAKRRL